MTRPNSLYQPSSAPDLQDASNRPSRPSSPHANVLFDRSISASPEPTAVRSTTPTDSNLTMFGICGLDVPAELSDQSLDADVFEGTPQRAGRRLAEKEPGKVFQLTPSEQTASASSDSAPPVPGASLTPPPYVGLEGSPRHSDGESTVRPELQARPQAQIHEKQDTPLTPQPTTLAAARPANYSTRHLGWGLKDEPARVRRLIEPDAPHIEELLRERFGWNSSLKTLQIEFVSRAQVRSYLHSDCGLTPTMSWLLSWALPMHYSPSLPSLSASNSGEALRRGRLLIVASNAWWLADSQLHYQLCQMMVLAGAHLCAPATFDRLQIYHTQPRIAAYLNDGLGGLLWGLSEVVATHFNAQAQAAQLTIAPWTWWHPRTLWQRVLEWVLGFFAKSELSPRRVGRQIAAQLAEHVETSPEVIERSLRMPGATVAIRAPAGEGAVARLKPDGSGENYPRNLFRKDIKFWENYNPNGGAIGYSFDDGSHFESHSMSASNQQATP